VSQDKGLTVPVLAKLNRTVLVVIALLVGAGIAIFALVPSARVDARDKSVDHSNGRVRAVAALGRIEPISEIINLGSGASDRLETLLVARGDVVKKGGVLGRLGGYAEQVSQRDYYQALLTEAERRLETEAALSQSRIEAAEIHLKLVREVSPLRIAAQEATINSIEAKLANDKDILDSQTQLLSSGSASRRLQQDQQSAVLQDQATLAAAKSRIAELKRQFEIDVADAQIQLLIARNQRDRLVADIPTASLRQQIALAEARALRATLFAPIDGQILNIRVKPGEDVSNGPILTMGDTDRMRTVAEVYETDISRVRLGQGAIINSTALARPISGKVSRVGNMIFKNDVLNVDPAARADARVVEVWIDLDDAEATRKLTNLTVSVVINPDGDDLSVATTDRP
jgi:HlyD family secretion protein